MTVEVKRASAPQAARGFFFAFGDAEDYPAKGGAKVRTLLAAVKEVREILKSPFAA